MYTMQTGTQMSKLKGKKNGLIRFFYLDEHKSCIRWRPSKKQDKAKSESSDVFEGSLNYIRTGMSVLLESPEFTLWTCCNSVVQL